MKFQIFVLILLMTATTAFSGQLSGIVTDSNGLPLDDVEISLYDMQDTSGLPLAPEFTNSEGKYLVDVPDGEHRYKILFSKTGYVEQWYKNAPMSDCAEPVSAPAEHIDAVLVVDQSNTTAKRSHLAAAPAAETGSISGTVSLHGAAFQCAKVEVYAADDDADWIDQAFTDYQGKYAATADILPEGEYKVLFYDQHGQPGQWYERQKDFSHAKTVSGDASGIDAAFPLPSKRLNPIFNLLF